MAHTSKDDFLPNSIPFGVEIFSEKAIIFSENAPIYGVKAFEADIFEATRKSIIFGVAFYFELVFIAKDTIGMSDFPIPWRKSHRPSASRPHNQSFQNDMLLFLAEHRTAKASINVGDRKYSPIGGQLIPYITDNLSWSLLRATLLNSLQDMTRKFNIMLPQRPWL